MKKETDDGMDQGEEGSEKGPLVGEGGNVTEVGVVSTAPHCRALSPLLALPPPPSSLERALYFQVENRGGISSLFLSFSLNLEIPSTFFFLLLSRSVPSFFSLLSFILRLFVSAISFFLSTRTTPSHTYDARVKLRFFFSSLFIVLHFFSSFLAYTPILDSGVCSSPVETRMKEKERRKRRMGRET